MKKPILCKIPKKFCNVRTEDGCCSLGAAYKCQPVVEKCKENDGCKKIENGYCSVYIFPKRKWAAGDCPMATHLEVEELSKKEQMKRRVGQQKRRKF